MSAPGGMNGKVSSAMTSVPLNARDELADILMSEDLITGTAGMDGRDYALAEADAILAAGYRKPKTITTMEELDALPEGSVIKDASGEIRERIDDLETAAALWYGSRGYCLSYQFKSDSDFPATVLHEGESE